MIEQNQKQFEAIVMSKYENQTEEDEILVKAIQYVVACSQDTACAILWGKLQELTREYKRSSSMVKYLLKEEQFDCVDCSIKCYCTTITDSYCVLYSLT